MRKIAFSDTRLVVAEVDERLLALLSEQSPEEATLSLARCLSRMSGGAVFLDESTGITIQIHPRYSHTEECRKAHEEWLDKRKEWIQAHPRACPFCFGLGYFTEGFGPDEFRDPCSNCEGRDEYPICAVCGQLLHPDTLERTCNCPYEGLPEEPICLCYLNEGSSP